MADAVQGKAKKGVVVLDFDGVIGDSVHECYVQSIKAYQELGGKLKDAPTVEAAFRAGRPLVTKAPHYLTILSMIEANPGIKFDFVTQTQFDAKVREQAQSGIGAEFEKKFMANRKTMQTADPTGWIRLQKSFPRIVPFLVQVAKKNNLFISTTKDAKSVIDLLKQYKLNIPAERVYAKEMGTDKRVHLQKISETTGVPLHRIVFVEDMPEQLRAVRSLGVKGVLVPWGYSTKAQRAAARKQRIPTLETTKKELKKIRRLTRRGRA